MADKKITQLPVATALNANDILTIVQGGANKQITKENACIANPAGGFLDGGVITPTSATTYNVSEYTGEFWNYSDNKSPVYIGKRTFAAQVKTDIHGTSPISSIYIDSTGTILQQPSQLEIDLVNEGYHFIGVLLHAIPNVITGVGSPKIPISNRADVIYSDFISRLSPLNEGDNSVSPNAADDKSINVSAGIFWQGSININTNRSLPSIINSSGATQPTFVHVWKNNLGVLQVGAPTNQIDNLNYNPGGASATLVAVPTSTPWVNMPAIYDPGSNTYAIQYATDAYATTDVALSFQGRFKHFPELGRASICGYIRVHKSAVNFVTQLDTTPIGVFFDGGEYWSYRVGGGGAGGSVGAIIPDQNNIIYVKNGGIDTDSGLKIETALATLQAALTLVATKSPTADNIWVIKKADAGELVIPVASAALTVLSYVHIEMENTKIKHEDGGSQGVNQLFNLSGQGIKVEFDEIIPFSSAYTANNVAGAGNRNYLKANVINNIGTGGGVYNTSGELDLTVGVLESGVVTSSGDGIYADIKTLKSNLSLGASSYGYVTIGEHESGAITRDATSDVEVKSVTSVGDTLLFSAKINKIPVITETIGFLVDDTSFGVITLLSSTSARSVTFPDDTSIPVGTYGEFVNINTGQWTFQSTGASSVVSLGGATKTNGQYSHIFWRKVSSTEYLVSGDLTT